MNTSENKPKTPFDSNPTMLYRGERYGVGDYVTMTFHRGHNATLISREDSGRVILLEEGHKLDIQPRDSVHCIVTCVKSESAPDWTGRTRNGFSIVRPIRIEDKKVQVERRELREHPPLDTVSNPEPEDSISDEEPAPKEAMVMATELKQESQYQSKPSDPQPITFEQIDLEFGDKTINVRGYTKLVELVVTLSNYSSYSQLRWNAKYLNDKENKILLNHLNIDALVEVVDVSYKKTMIPPFTARVQNGFVTVPKALSEYTSSYNNRKVLMRLYMVGHVRF